MHKNRLYHAKIKQLKGLNLKSKTNDNKSDLTTMETIINNYNDNHDNYEYGKEDKTYSGDNFDSRNRKFNWSEITNIQPPTPKKNTFFCSSSPSTIKKIYLKI